MLTKRAETYEENNRVFTVALGGAVPRDLIGTEDNTCESLMHEPHVRELTWRHQTTRTTARSARSKPTGRLARSAAATPTRR